MPVAQQLSVEHDDRPGSSLIVERTPDQAVSVSFTTAPPFATASNESGEAEYCPAADHALLQQAMQIARRCQARYVRCLLPEEARPHHRTALARCGFQPVTQICQREWTAESQARTASERQPTAPSAISFQTFELPTGGQDAVPAQSGLPPGSGTLISSDHDHPLTAGLQRMLDQIVTQSDDVSCIPPSTGRQLLRLWSLLNTNLRIVLAMHRTRPVGVVVTSQPGDSEIPATANPTLEYIGVISEWRRHKVASHLLTAAFAGFRSQQMKCRPRDCPLALTAYADQQNNAAQRFYDYHHFTTTARFELWICPPQT